MGMLDGLIQQLETSPIVQNAMKEFLSIKAILVATVNRFDQRFGVLDSKADRIIFLLEHPHQGAPAGDDGLMKILEDSGEQMIVRNDFKPITVVHETEVTNDLKYAQHHQAMP